MVLDVLLANKPARELTTLYLTSIIDILHRK